MPVILIIIFVLLVIGALPRWRHSKTWGYFPSGALGILLVIFVVLAVLGRL